MSDKNINIIKDIDPYVSPVTGEVITSRAKHKEHLKQTGTIEVGNENLAAHAQKIKAEQQRESVDFNKQITREYVRNYDPNREYRPGEWRAITERINSDLQSRRKK